MWQIVLFVRTRYIGTQEVTVSENYKQKVSEVSNLVSEAVIKLHLMHQKH